jgi:hypothetical protein
MQMPMWMPEPLLKSEGFSSSLETTQGPAQMPKLLSKLEGISSTGPSLALAGSDDWAGGGGEGEKIREHG